MRYASIFVESASEIEMVAPADSWSPPYIYLGLAEHEELMSRPALEAHVADYRQAEAARAERERREAEENYWREECRQGGMHRPGTCPYCRYYFD